MDVLLACTDQALAGALSGAFAADGVTRVQPRGLTEPDAFAVVERSRPDAVVLAPDRTSADLDELYRPDLNDSYWVGSILPDDKLKELYGN